MASIYTKFFKEETVGKNGKKGKENKGKGKQEPKKEEKKEIQYIYRKSLEKSFDDVILASL